ncbi:MAG: hypothetical protein COC19_00515 [SAR86 cluster bacterium]|uniref:Pyrrolo-quinoline quinone repeat domain-containing protein n=1 Tax=SAR86 cluster bacterium TaxID=2030880 RepID=A0A2A4MVZ0_9GAMM|nr:MAG: hypothetical protein COC19_00515 [SAR86 cluster bacterium]
MCSALGMIKHGCTAALILSLINCSNPQSLNEETARPSSEWSMYRGGYAGTGFSGADQITPENVGQLTQAWRYALSRDSNASTANTRGPNSQATPIVVDGIMYVPAADRIIALDPINGEELWRHQVLDGSPSRRGVAYWPGDDNTAARIIFTTGRHLMAIDAASGIAVSSFGEAGAIDMVVPYNSVPLVYDNIIIVGANTPRGAIGGIGNARAFDASSGAQLWEFSSVPQPGSLGHGTWAGDSWQGRLGANAWPFYFTVDVDSELLYLPLASPIPFGYGGDREGSNLFANSLVAVNIRSGEYVWHFQTIHHDLWDHDPPAPPVLFDIARGNDVIKALAVSTKSGYLYILDRHNGEAIYGVEETPMPQSNVPGEHTFATQPIPVRPPALARVSFDASDLVSASDTNQAHADACAELVNSAGELINRGPFTPWAYRPNPEAGETTLLFPGLTGGPNWGGVAFDPNSKLAFVYSSDIGALGWMQASEDDSALAFERRSPRPSSFDVRIGDSRWPCQKPPWSQLTAVDTTTGDIAWQQPIGITEGLPKEKQNTGRPGRAGTIVTASGLLFIASTDDKRIRALDLSNGEELWSDIMAQRGNANPMTFLGADNKQYVVIAATDALIAYRLP